MGRLNPAWKLASIFVAVGLTAFARRLDQSIWLALVPLVLLGGFSGLALRSVAKRLLPFVVFFALYIWTMTAYAAVGPHTPVIHVLWYRLSYPGFIKGLVLGFRMLAAVGFGLLFVSTIDLVDLVKSLSRNFKVPPKFSYGTLAGLRFFPQFQEEWRKLRLARRVRGRDARWSATRIVTYALPLLSDAVRLSERVAIAMEARGFRGRAADSSRHRTYYHPAASGWRDAVFGVLVIAAACLALWH
jgi:energy-coupling factor transport system ATP-binding protein